MFSWVKKAPLVCCPIISGNSIAGNIGILRGEWRAYGNGTTEGGVDFECAAAWTSGMFGQPAILSCGIGTPVQDYFAERFRKDKPADCPSVGNDQRLVRQMATAIFDVRCGGPRRLATPRAPSADWRLACGAISAQDPGDKTKRRHASWHPTNRRGDATVEIDGAPHLAGPWVGSHRQRHFKLSTDPYFVEKVLDIVGSYLHRPENAVVLRVDEKSQIQALERAWPMLPINFRTTATKASATVLCSAIDFHCAR
jgi:hypothetical protein